MVATASLELKVEKKDSHKMTSVCFSPDGSTIVSGSYDMTIKVWDAGGPARPASHPIQT
jgi:WD40 repeat protein